MECLEQVSTGGSTHPTEISTELSVDGEDKGLDLLKHSLLNTKVDRSTRSRVGDGRVSQARPCSCGGGRPAPAPTTWANTGLRHLFNQTAVVNAFPQASSFPSALPSHPEPLGF